MNAGQYALLHGGWTLVTGLLGWLLVKDEYQGTGFYLIAAAFGLSTLLSLGSYVLVFFSLRKRPAAFVSGVMLSLFLKMMLGLLAILLVAWKFREFAIPFALSYMIAYFLFTPPEVFFLYRAARKI